MEMELGLQGKKVFITGSTRGIGLATAEAFIQEGAEVVLNGRDERSLHVLSQRLEKKYDRRVFYLAANILSENEVSRIKWFLEDTVHGLDIFVANLGSGKPESENPLDVKEWKRFYDVNVMGGICVLDQIYPLLKAGKDSSVTLISSIAAKGVISAPPGYASAKTAVCTLNKYLSRKWAGDGIRVNCVLPGNVFFQGGRWEELLNKDKRGVTEYIESCVPMKRFGEPKEIADMILFLSSKRASFITGAEISIDGGQLNVM
ncbi:MAG: SDR family oxidoreductase [Hungatella sp.]|jgi:3-oxoacyl-[acyl-carrier protein] reductase|nr:SDR family oxidoreductase [Hungatella sp.]